MNFNPDNIQLSANTQFIDFPFHCAACGTDHFYSGAMHKMNHIECPVCHEKGKNLICYAYIQEIAQHDNINWRMRVLSTPESILAYKYWVWQQIQHKQRLSIFAMEVYTDETARSIHT